MRLQTHYDEDLGTVVDPPCDECKYCIIEDIWWEYMCARYGAKCPYENEEIEHD